MRGSAVATIVWSSAASSVASMIALNATSTCRCERRSVAIEPTTLARMGQQPGAAGQLELQPAVGVLEVDAGELLANPAHPVGDGVLVQVQSLRAAGQRAVLVEI